MSTRIFVLATAILLWFVVPVAAAPDMREGEWEMTMTMEMPGLPFAMPPIKNTVCLTKEEMVPQKAEAGQNCAMKEQKTVGNTVSWVMECKDENGTMHSEGKITYQGDSFSGTINSTTTSPDGTMPINQKISGRRLGACK